MLQQRMFTYRHQIVTFNAFGDIARAFGDDGDDGDGPSRGFLRQGDGASSWIARRSIFPSVRLYMTCAGTYLNHRDDPGFDRLRQ